MAVQVIKPVLYYDGDFIERKGKKERVPVTDKWIIWILFKKQLYSDKEKMIAGFARTDNKGVMYQCRGTIKFSDGEFYATQLTPHWFMKKHRSWEYLPVSFAVNQKVALFIWPYTKVMGRTVSVNYLQKNGLIVQGYIRPQSKAIALVCPLDIYIERIKHYTKNLNKKITPYQKRIAKGVTCGAIFDQAYNLVVGRGRAIQVSLATRASIRKGYYITSSQILNSPNIEAVIINIEVIEKMKNILVKYIKGETRRFKRRIFMDVAILGAILRSQLHNWLFLNADWSMRNNSAKYESSEEVSKVYVDAYLALWKTDTKIARKLYAEHFKNLIAKSAKGKNNAKRAIEEINYKAKWVGTMTDGILKITAGARTYKMASDLSKLRDDFIGACYYLEVRGVLKNVENLEEKLDDLIKRLDQSLVRDIPVNAASYYDDIAPLSKGTATEIKGAISSGISAIALLTALQKESKNNRDTVEKAMAVYGFATSVMDIPAINSRIPKGAVLSKATGTAGAVVDWGISIYDMYDAADTGEGKKFAYSVVSYAGKGFIAGGSILLITPLAPLGAVLVGIGTAITIIGSICEGIIEYKTVEEKKFIQLMTDKIRENDPSKEKWIADHYKYEILKAKVKNADTITELKKQNPGNTHLIDKVTDDLIFEEYIHKFFVTEYWGFQYEKLEE